MKRTIEFNYQDDVFFLQEGDSRIFTILASDLKFNSVDFYSGVYKGKSADITLVNKCESDPYKKEHTFLPGFPISYLQFQMNSPRKTPLKKLHLRPE